MKFEELFKEIPVDQIADDNNIFTLVGKESFAITAGKADHYNSMIGSGGGFGMMFRNPVTWCIIRSDRYTLELMEQEGVYTMSYFQKEYREQMMFLGSKSGRDSNKMQESTLSAIETSSGIMAFAEAKLIIECKLIQVTMPAVTDFRTPETKEYLEKAYQNPTDQRQYVFGEITHAWVKIDE